MQNHKAIRNRVYLLSLLVICLCQMIWIVGHYPFEPVLSKVVAKYPVGSRAMVYSVLSDAGGATVPFMYRYYVFERLDDDVKILEALSGAPPFLVTRDGNVQIQVNGASVSARVRGDVHSFNSTTVLRPNADYKLININLDSRYE